MTQAKDHTAAPSPIPLFTSGARDETLYDTSVSVIGGPAAHGRMSGVVHSDDGKLELELRMPEELGGPGGGTNPEQLFAAGYAACFHGSLMLLAARKRVEAPNTSVRVKVSFRRDASDGLFMLSTKVEVRMPDLARSLAADLVRNAERVCPYAKMAREGIESIVVLVADET